MSVEKKEGKNLEDIQEMNRALVIRTMRKFAVCSRIELAKETGLKKSTITNLVNDFIDKGLVIETGIIDGKKGRRSIGIALNGDKFKVIGVRLERKFFTVALFDIRGTVDEMVKEKIGTEDPGTTIIRMKRAINEMLSRARDKTVLSIGLAVPGPFIREEGRIGLMTQFPGWDKIPLQKEFQKEFSIPVYIEHDAHLGALAEWWYGTDKTETGTFLYILAGHGIGSGIIVNGRIYTGSLGIAGEFGHMSIAFNGPKCECGNNGCLTHYCSIYSIRRKIERELVNYPNSILKNGELSSDAIVNAIRQGDELAVAVFKEAAWYLGFGLSSFINILNPEMIIIGDALASVGRLLYDIVDEVIKEHVLSSVYNKLQIRLSSFKEDPILIGAGLLAIDKGLAPDAITKLCDQLREEEDS